MTQEHDLLDPETPADRLAQAELDELDELGPDEERVLELREEELVPNTQLHELGEVIVRTEMETVPAQLEVEALREEVEVAHEPVGESVSKREEPREENGELVVPIYEEQLVVSKRLILRERLHVRRIGTSERQLFQDTVRRERLVIEDPQQTRLVHEVYPSEEPPSVQNGSSAASDGASDDEAHAGLLTRVVTKVLE
ncbi:MAG: YsnF/AvaK domain-containing protein [Chloroflexi bacterium]|nr:YsnF/AvaK domain-containing protein [Chloroflexota bacterium]